MLFQLGMKSFQLLNLINYIFRSKKGTSEYEYKVGLWKLCTIASDSSKCVDISCSSGDNTCSEILASRAFVTLACILSPIAALCLFASAIITADDMKQTVLLAGRGLAFACIIVGIIGVTIGIIATRNYNIPIDNSTSTDYNAEKSASYSTNISSSSDYGSIIGILANILELIGSIVSLLDKLDI